MTLKNFHTNIRRLVSRTNTSTLWKKDVHAHCCLCNSRLSLRPLTILEDKHRKWVFQCQSVSYSDILRAYYLQTLTFWICRLIQMYTAWCKKSHHLDLNKQIRKSLELDDFCSDLCFRLVAVTNLVASHHTTTAHPPWTTTPIIHCTHTFPSTITPITQLSPITHQPWLSCHTCTSFTHPHISSTLPYTRCEVLFVPRLTFLSVYHSLWLILLCLTPDCLTLELWTCACDLDPCLVLFTSLLCLWYSCYCLLTIACLILPLSNKYYCTWIHTPLTSLYSCMLSNNYFIPNWCRV